MRRMGSDMGRVWLGGLCLMWAASATAEPLTADRAVAMALQRNSQVINAEASVLDARGGLYSAYSGVLPRISGSLTRSTFVVDNETGGRNIGGGLTASVTSDYESHGTTPSVGASWSVLNLSSLSNLSAARNGLKAAKLSRNATRSDVVLIARRQFYEVVKAVRLAEVADGAVKLSRDDERRVRALFEVGSVSRGDLLKAQVRTAQSQLDSLTAHQSVINQRIVLAGLLGVREAEMPEVDTLLTAEPQSYDESALVAEAAKGRPDLLAADAELISARAGRNAARLARLPYVSASAGVDLKTKSRATSTIQPPGQPPFINPGISSSTTETDRQTSAQISLNLDLFDGFAMDARSASANARLMRAQETRNALRRNLEGEVHQAFLAYNEAIQREQVARRALESATENLKLTQEKYNVGSATILELIDAQVQLQRAQSDGVSALAAIRVAEAQLNRVRGRAE